MRIAGHRMKLTDYLFLRTPPSHLGATATGPPQPGQVPKLAIVISLIGIVLGIVASFYVTGLRPNQKNTGANQGVQITNEASKVVSGSGAVQPQIKADARPFWKI